MKYSVVLQSFGKEFEYRRAVFCLLSLFRFNNPNLDSVILFTDNPDYFILHFAKRDIQFAKLNEEIIRTMRGEIDFLHRMKIAIIEEAFRQRNGNLLYVDSDTFFLESPEQVMTQLSPRVSFMHKHEYQFNTLKYMPLPAGASFQAFHKLLNSTEFVLPNQSKQKILTEFSSWNAGAIALHATHMNFLHDVYSLTDQFYPPTQNHASEQYAFSIVLQTQTIVNPLEQIIYHYWYRIKKTVVDGELIKLLTPKFLSIPENKKFELTVKLVQKLPTLLDNHILILRDNSIQLFHENKFSKGFAYAVRALIKNPFDMNFFLDVGYHFKRWMKQLLS